jgi:hypothetical protein
MTSISRKICLLVAIAFVVSCLYANERSCVGDFSLGMDERGAPKGWQLKEKLGQAQFSLGKVDGLDALMLRSTNTSFSFQREVRADLNDYPILSWKWKVTKLPEGGDFRSRRTDDQAAQLFVGFSKSKFIVYIWDTTAPKDLMADAFSPPFMSIKVVVLRSGEGDAGKWITETRNVYEDYKRLYGDSEKPPVVSGMRIQINTQHTRTSAESYFADLSFKKAEDQTRAD